MEYRGTRCPGLCALGGVPASGPAAALSVRLRLRLPSRVGSAVGTPACAPCHTNSFLPLGTPLEVNHASRPLCKITVFGMPGPTLMLPDATRCANVIA